MALPGRGEPLNLADEADMLADSPVVRAALLRLSYEKAPANVAQLVLWNVRAGLDWTTISRLSKKWANANEVALARHFVRRLAAANGVLPKTDSGVLYFEIGSQNAGQETSIAEIRDLLKDKAVVGLAAQIGIPTKPEGPAVACRVHLIASGNATEAVVQVLTTDNTGREWVSAGKFNLPLVRDAKGQLDSAKLLDQVAEGTLSRLVRVQLLKEKIRDKKGNVIHMIKIENASPLVLNGLALSGTRADAEPTPAPWPASACLRAKP